MFKALVLDQKDGKTISEIKQLDEDSLPPGEVIVEVSHSSLNYKDGLAVTGKGKIVSHYPMVPGIDLAGTVRESSVPEYRPGDPVIVTGWGVGERHWGGFAELARVQAGWLVPMPEGMDAVQAMVIGTAGLTAMLCVMALEDGHVTPDKGTVIVTGASGGVGSVAVALLARLGYRVAAVTGRATSGDYLQQLGASEILSREEMSVKPRPLEKQRWAGSVDTVGGVILARVLAETQFDGTVAACGLAASVDLPTTVMPFILRNVRLQGVESVQCPFERRKIAWRRLQQELPESVLGEMESLISLEQVPEYAEKITLGQVRGRTVIDLKR
ncbi:MAG: oxidoreductase [Gammaproteobacteria bacterium]|nr:oxidoreductase [Gammaproteobacteria bacterium]